MSRAPRPIGPPPAAWTAGSRASQSATVSAVSTKTSKPSSPVYPVRRHERPDAGHGPLAGRVVAQPGDVDVGQRRDDLDGTRALDGEQPGRQRPVVKDRLEPLEAPGQRIRHDRRIAGVGDHQEAGLAQSVDDEVVDDPAIRRAHHRVVGAADGQAGWIRDEGRGQRGAGLRAVDVELAHVRQVEQPDPLADGPVLVDDRAVLDGHQPAAELDEPGAEVAVDVGQRGEVDLRLEPVGHEPASATGPAVVGTAPMISAARTTRARSVSKVSIVAAASNPTQRTSSNSWSWSARSPPIGSIRK